LKKKQHRLTIFHNGSTPKYDHFSSKLSSTATEESSSQSSQIKIPTLHLSQVNQDFSSSESQQDLLKKQNFSQSAKSKQRSNFQNESTPSFNNFKKSSHENQTQIPLTDSLNVSEHNFKPSNLNLSSPRIVNNETTETAFPLTSPRSFDNTPQSQFKNTNQISNPDPLFFSINIRRNSK
jgi:hypothetical protein